MDTAALLLLLRLLSAGVLLAFVGVVGWLLQREIDEVSRDVQAVGQLRGTLLIRQPDAPLRSVPLRSVLSIGRTPGNAIVIDNSYTSGRHALITWRDNQWWIEDLQSRNGTLLNDIAVERPTAIMPGDIIAIGDTELQLELHTEE